jgi:peptidyl-prolyl cis-trans isomerase B (cyclophilin B)
VSGTDKRREAARRQLEKKLEQRQLDEARRRRTTLVASVVSTVAVIALIIVVIVVASGSDGKKSPKAGSGASVATSPATSPTTSAAGTPAASYPCTWTKSGTAARKVTAPSTTTPPKTGTAVVTVKTTQGQMTFTLNRAAAPCTVASFVSLISQKYYDDTPCHRLTTTGIFVLQCGDPTGTGTGGPGYTIPDEYKSTDKFTTGVLAMANTGQPDTGGSQFFIVYKNTSLPPQYTIFGKVTAGLDVVTKVAAKGSDNSNGAGDGKPKLPITINSMTAAG